MTSNLYCEQPKLFFIRNQHFFNSFQNEIRSCIFRLVNYLFLLYTIVSIFLSLYFFIFTLFRCFYAFLFQYSKPWIVFSFYSYSYLLTAFLVVVYARSIRQKRQVFLLPDNVDLVLNAPLVSTFRCDTPGYFADIENNCQLFHICDVQVGPNNVEEVRQYSFACGNLTVFNQFTMTCTVPDEAVPCGVAPQFYRYNEKIGQPETPIHSEADIAEAAQYIPHSAGAPQ